MEHWAVEGIDKRLREMFSASVGIAALQKELEERKKEAPENHQLKVTMMTSEGEVMRVREIRSVGFQMFSAIGFVNETDERMISGHISRLEVSVSYESLNGQNKVGVPFEFSEFTH